MTKSQKSYVQFMRVMARLFIACIAGFVVVQNFGHVSPWGI